MTDPKSPALKRKFNKKKYDESVTEALNLIKSLNHPAMICMQDAKLKRGLSERFLIPAREHNSLEKIAQGTPHEEFKSLNRKMMRHVAQCLLRAVAYLHENQLYHGDLSPRNILIDCLSYDLRMLTRKSKILIADSGSVTAAHRRHAPCGDLRFQSPESVIIQSNYASREHDVWMVGAALIFLANGKQIVNYESRFAHDGASYYYIDRFGRKTNDVSEMEMRSFVRRSINRALDDKSGYTGSVTRCAAKFLRFYPEDRKLLGKH